MTVIERRTLPVARIAVVGGGPCADSWARVMRGCEGALVERVDGAGTAEAAVAAGRTDIDAVVIGGQVGDVAAVVDAALAAGKHVFVATAPGCSSRQVGALRELAAERGRLLLFDSCGAGDERLAFIRKMVTGPHALWRPRYIRLLRSGADEAALADLAAGDIGVTLALMGALPYAVTAVSPRVDDESGGVDVAMITLMFAGGPAARVDISLMEPVRRHEVVVVCEGRTLVMDACDPRAPLQVHARGGHRGPAPGAMWSETVSEYPPIEPGSREHALAEVVVEAVRRDEAAISNAAIVADAVLVWERARASIARGGELVTVARSDAPTSRPALQLIRGGGRASATGRTPVLRVIGGDPDAAA